ncbi:glycosyltransferase family 25 protein [Periconia macrospinosa]|uniref:Glycosyltransferase family 25 protein n=1 Tax=Periconia macrospinosa TaxID=97972 RepID=A0A2V1E3Y8_9PLEO|nr:glycosyltransferase family 25 protein [Periconia macrospinosa]
MLAPSRKRPIPLLVAFALTLLFFTYTHNTGHIYRHWTPSLSSQHDNVPANSTLGFGAMVVVSKNGSKRRHSLLQAANVTNLDLTIPEQPQWTENEVERFRNGQQDKVQVGSILAWLGHRNALQWFLDSGLETALILEDDVDWDIRLRTVQAPLAARAARSLLSSKWPRPLSKLRAKKEHYWGDHRQWDLLYLGHCGDYFNQITEDGEVPGDTSYDLSGSRHITYNDPTLPTRSDLHPFTQSLFNTLRLPAHSRIFHRSKFPLCSFGYAVTRPAAERLLNDLATPKLSEGGPRAFDVALLDACHAGSKTPSPTPWRNPYPHPNPMLRHKYASPGLRCWTLNSELFHHMPGSSQIAEIGWEIGEEHGIPPVDLAGQAQVVYRNESTNIGCGFWSRGFAFDDADHQRLEWLQEEVGRRGRCLKYDREG